MDVTPTTSQINAQETLGSAPTGKNLTPTRNEDTPIAVGGLPTKANKPKKFISGLHPIQGRQVVKGYAVTEDQLHLLSTLGYEASISFTLASGLLGFALNLMVSRDLSTSAPTDSLHFWGGVEVSCFYGAIVFGVVALILATVRIYKVYEIKSKTKFEIE